MKLTLIFIFMFLGLLVACTPSDAAIQTAIAETQQVAPTAFFTDPPIEALATVRLYLEQQLAEEQENTPYPFTYDPSSLFLERSQSVALNRADELGKINEQWCLSFRHVIYFVNTDLFVEIGTVFEISNIDGEWIIREIFEGTDVEIYDSRWNHCILDWSELP